MKEAHVRHTGLHHGLYLNILQFTHLFNQFSMGYSCMG